MPNTKILKENGQEFYPVTHASLIVGMENQGRMDATYAWDGTGTPDITKIPAGVVVTYDGADYTGTLAASADTAGRFYLVPSTTVTGEYDRYLTDATGNTITWKPAGTTAIPTPSILDNVTSTDTDKALSANQGKLLKDDLSQLEAKVTDLNDVLDIRQEGGDVVLADEDIDVSNYSFNVYIDIDAGETLKIEWSGLRSPNYGSLVVNVADRTTSAITPALTISPVVNSSGESTFNVPIDARYIQVRYTYNDGHFTLTKIGGEVTKYSQRLYGIEEDVQNLELGQTEQDASIKSAFGIMAEGYKCSKNIPVSWISGAYYNASATLANQANYSHASVDVSQYRNQPLKIELFGATTGLVYALITDEGGETLQSICLDQEFFEGVYTIPENAKYFLLSNRHASGPGYLKGGSLSYMQSLSYLVPVLGKVTILGDSITYGVGASKPSLRFSTLLCQRLGATENNLGVAGTLLASGQTGHTEESRFVSRATVANLEGSDLIIVFGGTNDFTYDGKAIGPLFSESSITPGGYIGDKQKGAIADTDTFAGALHELINTIRTNCPDVPILFVTPLNRGNYNEQSPSSFQCNRWGNYLYEFVNAIKEICAFYSIPVCEMNQSNLDFSNAHTASEFSVDTLHPNDKGHRLIADTIYNFIITSVIV